MATQEEIVKEKIELERLRLLTKQQVNALNDTLRDAERKFDKVAVTCDHTYGMFNNRCESAVQNADGLFFTWCKICGRGDL